MPALLVHGNPDSHLLWEGVIEHLGPDAGEVVAVDLPGFFEPKPDGFEATKEGYVDWIIERLEELAERGGKVDLVGHDWGSLMVQRVASIRPDLLSSLTAGGATVDPTYPWHEIAQIWQTPEEGERYMEQDLTPEVSVPYLVEHGMPQEYAERNSWLVPGNKQCILDLYRSAVHIGDEWGAEVDKIDLPSMVVWGRHDPYVPLNYGDRLAARLRGSLVVLECGHWWPFERPAETAAALRGLWAVAAAG